MPLNNPSDVSGIDGIVQASGTIYYANATNGSDSNNGTTPDSAFLTIIYAVSQMVAGDVLQIANGTYNETANGAAGVSISTNALTLVGNVPGVTITNTDTTNGGRVFTITANNVVLKNIIISKSETTSNNSIGIQASSAVGLNIIDCPIILEKNNHIGIQYTDVSQYCNTLNGDQGFMYILSNTGVGIGIDFDNCTFCASSSGSITSLTTGVQFSGNASSNYLLKDTFISNCTTGITLAVGAANNWLAADVEDCTTDYADNSGNATNVRYASLTHLHTDATHVPRVAGNIYFTDGTNGVDTNSGRSPEESVATITQGIALMSAGDVLTVREGTYDENGLDLSLNGLELWCETGVTISNTTPGTCLTISGNSCKILGNGLVLSQAGQTGLAITGNSAWIESVIANACAVGFDLDGNNAVFLKGASFTATTTGFDIAGTGCIIQDGHVAGDGSATRGYYLSANTADFCVLDNCSSVGNATAGFEVVAGANYNEFKRCTSGGGDGDKVDNGTWNHWPDFYHKLDIEHHEHVYPFPNGEGTAGSPVTVNTDAEDETHAAATTADYWGEPSVLVPRSTIAEEWDFIGLNLYGTTTAKSIRAAVYKVCPLVQSARNGGNAWDEGATVLTVADGSLFQASDLVWIYSTYKTNGEIVQVSGVVGNVVTIARETSQFGVPNTGLRWNHTTNAAGTEVMNLCWRDQGGWHEFEFDFSVASARDFVQERWNISRTIQANCGLICRSQNSTDNTNNTRFDATVIYKD